MILVAAASDLFRAVCRQAVPPTDCLIEVQDFSSLRALLGKASPRLLVVEMGLRGFTRSEKAWLLERCECVRTVVAGQLPNTASEVDWYVAGVRAVCPEDIDVQELRRVLAAVDRGETWMRRALVPQLIARLGRRSAQRNPSIGRSSGHLPAMTARETEVAHLVAGGYSNKQIARRLAITERTVKFHLTALFRKLGVEDRVMLALHVAADRSPALPPGLFATEEEPAPLPDIVPPMQQTA